MNRHLWTILALGSLAFAQDNKKDDKSLLANVKVPPGFNLTLTDYNTADNITAAKTTATLGFRPSPNDRSAEIVAEIEGRAEAYGFEVESRLGKPFQTTPDAAIVQASLAATGLDRSVVVPYGTEAAVYQDLMDIVILGPGDIAQAHTDGEWIELAQLHEAVEVYTRLIEQLCM